MRFSGQCKTPKLPGFHGTTAKHMRPSPRGFTKNVDAVKVASRRCLDRDGTSGHAPCRPPAPEPEPRCIRPPLQLPRKPSFAMSNSCILTNRVPGNVPRHDDWRIRLSSKSHGCTHLGNECYVIQAIRTKGRQTSAEERQHRTPSSDFSVLPCHGYAAVT